MKQNAILVVTSLLSICLLTLHITDDIVRGISKAESSNTALFVLVVLLYGTLVLAGRRSGYVIIALGSLLALVIPAVHVGKSGGSYFFVWTLLALSVTAVFSLIVSTLNVFARDIRR